MTFSQACPSMRPAVRNGRSGVYSGPPRRGSTRPVTAASDFQRMRPATTRPTHPGPFVLHGGTGASAYPLFPARGRSFRAYGETPLPPRREVLTRRGGGALSEVTLEFR